MCASSVSPGKLGNLPLGNDAAEPMWDSEPGQGCGLAPTCEWEVHCVPLWVALRGRVAVAAYYLSLCEHKVSQRQAAAVIVSITNAC